MYVYSITSCCCLSCLSVLPPAVFQGLFVIMYLANLGMQKRAFYNEKMNRQHQQKIESSQYRVGGGGVNGNGHAAPARQLAPLGANDGNNGNSAYATSIRPSEAV